MRGTLFRNAILMGVDDATLTGAPSRMLLGSVTDLKQPDAIIIDRAGYHRSGPVNRFRWARSWN